MPLASGGVRVVATPHPLSAEPGLLQGPLPLKGPQLVPRPPLRALFLPRCGRALTHCLSPLLCEEQN